MRNYEARCPTCNYGIENADETYCPNCGQYLGDILENLKSGKQEEISSFAQRNRFLEEEIKNIDNSRAVPSSFPLPLIGVFGMISFVLILGCLGISAFFVLKARDNNRKDQIKQTIHLNITSDTIKNKTGVTPSPTEFIGSPAFTFTPTITQQPTNTFTPTTSPTATSTPTVTLTPTITRTPSKTPTRTLIPTATRAYLAGTFTFINQSGYYVEVNIGSCYLYIAPYRNKSCSLSGGYYEMIMIWNNKHRSKQILINGDTQYTFFFP